jgi:hypothetical protein
MHLRAIYRETSIAQSPLVPREYRALSCDLGPARGMTIASALGAFMWGAIAGMVWLFV